MTQPKRGAVSVLPESLPWKTFPGSRVDYRVLRRHDGTGGGMTLLLRFPPGSDYSTHEHPAGEEYFVVEGTLEDGGLEYSAGSYVYHPPGSFHRPRSSKGCIVFVHLPAAVVLREP